MRFDNDEHEHRFVEREHEEERDFAQFALVDEYISRHQVLSLCRFSK